MSVTPSTTRPDGAASQLTSDQYWVCASGMTSSPPSPMPAYVLGKIGILPCMTYTGPELARKVGDQIWTFSATLHSPGVGDPGALFGRQEGAQDGISNGPELLPLWILARRRRHRIEARVVIRGMNSSHPLL